MTSDGKEGVVSSVTDDGRVLIDSDGTASNSDLSGLSLAPISRGDTVRILVGGSRGTVCTVDLVEKNELFVRPQGGSGVQIFRAEECGKIKP
jgi:hypothetical protein